MDGPRVAVVGAGIAGLTAAYRLRGSGCVPTVFESDERVGGRIWTVRKGDFLMDLGTAVYLGTYRHAIELINEVGLGDQLVERAAMGAVPRAGTNHYLNYGTPVRTAVGTRAISLKSKLLAIKLITAVVRARKSLGYDTYDGFADLDTESVAQYCERELNSELRRYVGQPLVSGTWVANDEESSVALMFWTIRNMLVPSVFNLVNGVAALPEELASRVDVRLSHRVENVTDTGTAVEVTYVDSIGVSRVETFDAAVIATTAQPALQIYPQMDDNHRELYSTTKYRKLGSICLGLSECPPDPATYFLVPPVEDPDTISVVADHRKAPGRAPEGKGLVTVLLSHEYLERSEALSDDQVLQHAVARASHYHGRDLSGLVEEHAVVRWQESVPAIDTGRFRRIAAFQRALDPNARVQFASDLDRIPGLNGALVSGQEAAARVCGALRLPSAEANLKPADRLGV